mgnify:CR=1 FL=1
MKLFKKNQIIIYVIALMLVTAGYLNYTTTNDMNSIMQTSSREEEITEMANIGDAQLVSSNVSDENNLSNNQDTSNAITNNGDSQNIEINTIKEKNKNEEVKENNSNNASVTTSSNNNSKDDYFTNSKLERNTMYSQMLETYEKVLNSNNSLETQKQSATDEIKKINNLKNSIMICENLIQTKGFKDVVVFVNDDSVSVVVATTELTKENVAQIQNIIARELKVEVDNIHISNK